MKHVHQVKPAAALLSVIYYEFFDIFSYLVLKYILCLKGVQYIQNDTFPLWSVFFCSFCNVCTKKMHWFHFHLVVGEAGGTSGQDYLYPIS